MKPNSLTIKAGKGALESLHKHGFDIGSIGTIAGASGGAKWLVLSQLDRAILENLVPRLEGPVHLVGTSIGSWRFACYAQQDPLAAIDRFERAYVDQEFSARPDIHEITAKSQQILNIILGPHGVDEILRHPVFRSHIMAVRSRHVLASENRWILAPALIAAATLNVLHRRTLGWFFERALFHDDRDRPPFFDAGGFPLRQFSLDRLNFADAVLATGAIPLVLLGVRDIAGATPGLYRDGGIIDYHHDLPHSADDRMTLYPHFYDYIVPGWFDKRLKWRRPGAANIDRTILVSPSRDFVARLPNAKIPDRRDFVKMSPTERVRAWRQCIADCERLGDEFAEILEFERLPAYATPF